MPCAVAQVIFFKEDTMTINKRKALLKAQSAHLLLQEGKVEEAQTEIAKMIDYLKAN